MNTEKLKAAYGEVNRWSEEEREFFLRALQKGWPIDLEKEEIAEFCHHLFTDKKRNPHTKGTCSEYKGAGISPIIWSIGLRIHRLGGKPSDDDCQEILKQMNYSPMKYRGIWAEMTANEEDFMEETEKMGEAEVIRPSLESAIA